MLLRYSIKNFASFHELTTLDLNNRSKKNKTDVSTRLLHNVMIFGSSGSGKSNLMDGLRVIRGLMQGKNVYYAVGENKMLTNWHFHDSDYTEISLDFSIDYKVYRYRIRIKQQMLSRIEGNDQPTFHIAEEELSIATGNYLDPSVSDEEKFRVLICRDNISTGFLEDMESWELNESKMSGGYTPIKPHGTSKTKLNQTIKLCNYSMTRYPETTVDKKKHLDNLRRWFLEKLRIVGFEDTTFSAFEKTDLSDMVEVLKSLGFDFSKVYWQEVDNRPKLTNDEEYAIKKMKKIIKRCNGAIYRIDRKDVTEELIVVGSDGSEINLSHESEGTRRLVELSEVAVPTDGDLTFIIDEVNRKLHPCLTLQLMSLVANDHISRKQVIVTSHEPALLTSDILSTGEKWYVFKDKSQRSRLYMIPDGSGESPIDLWQLFRDGQIESYYGWEE